jgi:hypothetical protein
MKRKIIILVLMFLMCSLFALDFGFDSAYSVINVKDYGYGKDFVESKEISIFLSQKFNFNNFFILIKPALNIVENELYFNFYELKLSYVGNYFALSAGKNNFIFGKPIYKNLLFPNVSVPQLNEYKFWNCKVDFMADNFCITAGALLDNDLIDKYEKLKWYDCFLLMDYSNDFLETKVEYDFNNDLDGSVLKHKTALEISFIGFDNFDFYLDYSFNNNHNFFSGITYNKYTTDFLFSLTGECGIYEEKFCYSLNLFSEVNNNFDFLIQFLHQVKSNMKLKSRINLLIKDLNIYAEFESKNFLKEINDYRISIGVKSGI